MLLISDANIFIDFDCCGLITELFQLPNDIAVPDVLFIEELEERHPGLPDMGLVILSVLQLRTPIKSIDTSLGVN